MLVVNVKSWFMAKCLNLSTDPTINPNPINPTDTINPIDTIVVDDRYEVVNDVADIVEETDPALNRLVEEEEEFFNFSNDNIRDKSPILEPLNNTTEEEVARPTRQRKV
jgi:hypothetical protein